MISIIVPVYNAEKYLPQCLDSLINQTYQDIEIICVNDGSTDNSLAILKDYAERDERIRIISQANQGLSGARNAGMLYAKGEWVMFVDSDDWVDANCCDILIKNSQEMDLVFFSYIREFSKCSAPKYIFDKSSRQFNAKNIEWLFSRLIAPTETELRHPEKLDSFSTAWGKLYKTSIIKEHNIEFVSTKEIGTEDLLFNVYYFTWIKRALYLPETFYHYRKNNITSLTKLYKPRLTEQWNLLFKKLEIWIKPMGKVELEYALSNRRALSLIGLGLNITFAPCSLSLKLKALHEILYNEKYISSLRKLPMEFFPLHWKVFYLTARYQMTFFVMCMLLTMKKIISK